MDDQGKPALEIWPPAVEEITLIDAKKHALGRTVEETFKIAGLTHDGDYYTAYLQCNEPNAFARTKEIIENHRAETGLRNKQDEYAHALVRLLKARLRVNLSEVGSLLTTFGLPGEIEDSRREVESLIIADRVEGMIDGNTFVNRFAVSTRASSHSIVISFDFKDSTLQIRCPSCAAALSLKNKDSVGKCQYCEAAYMVPSKILSLI
jgi:uncharacterized CHY-type Zn-finger protein